ncbi:MAG: sigma factor-like helix-turn-helix DNA-binding protein [Pseudomonadota bacterium]
MSEESLPRNVGFFRPDDRDEKPADLDEELELEAPLDDELEDDDSHVVEPQELPPSSGSTLTSLSPTETSDDFNDVTFEFDDDDDIDDFDDLGDLDALPLSRLPDKVSYFQEIDLNGIASPDRQKSGRRDEPPVPPTDFPTEESAPDATLEPSSSSLSDPAVDDRPVADPAADGIKPLGNADPLPTLEEPILQEPPKSIGLEEAPIAPMDGNLALQPIPELQSTQRLQTLQQADERDDETVDPFDDVTEYSDADEFETSRSEPDTAEVDLLDLEGLEIAPSDQTDDQIADDWHAHMADVLTADSEQIADEDLNDDEEPETKSVSQTPIEPSPTVLPLSKTIAEIAASSEPEDDAPPLVPTYFSRTVRKKTAAGQPPSTLPADDTDLSPSQLSLGIITNVPRLRRFAAAQIGDELIADQLVRGMIETALADPSTLQHAADLGLGLIALLHQRRQAMLKNGSEPALSPEAAHAFETALCRGLAGADQFEIHQFAQAINSLDERDRGLLVLVSLENLTYEQIAAVVQVPREQIMSLVSGARMHLRQALAAEEPDSEIASSDISIPHPQEVEIHGYLDGELDGRHMVEVDALVDYDEDAADRLLQYGIQGDLIRRLYAPLLNRPIPGRMLDAFSTATRPARRSFGFGPRRALTAGAFMMVLGGSALSLATPADGMASDFSVPHLTSETVVKAKGRSI